MSVTLWKQSYGFRRPVMVVQKFIIFIIIWCFFGAWQFQSSITSYWTSSQDLCFVYLFICSGQVLFIYIYKQYLFETFWRQEALNVISSKKLFRFQAWTPWTYLCALPCGCDRGRTKKGHWKKSRDRITECVRWREGGRAANPRSSCSRPAWLLSKCCVI